MTKKFKELAAATMDPEVIARAKARARVMSSEMPLYELRRARGLSQESLAAVLHVSQAAVSKIERRTDMYLSTLRSHIRAMGGELEITAKFPDGEVHIQTFGEEQGEQHFATA